MANVYSTRFLEAHGTSSPQTYVVPIGFVAVLRCADVYANVTGSSDFFLEGALGQTIWWYHWNPLDQNHSQWTGRQVFVAGETITANPQMAPLDLMDLTVSGFLLTAP